MMRSIKLITVVGLMLALTSTAGAISIGNGPQEAKFNDFTSIYRAPGTIDPITGLPFAGSVPPRPGQTLDPVPNPAPGQFVPVLPGDENRAIINITTITPDIPGAPGPDFVGIPGVEQVSGLFYDLTPVAIVLPPVVGGAVTIEYGALGRNPLPAAVADPRAGGVIEMYVDAAPGMSNFNELSADPWGLGYSGPEAWDEADSLGVNAATPYAGRDTFPTVNTSGEKLYLQMVFIPFPGAGIAGSGVAAGTLLRETLGNLAGDERGVGAGFAMIVGGSFGPFVTAGGRNASYAGSGYAVPAGLSADFEIRFNFDPSETSAPPWGAASDDPSKFSVIPEPVTMLGLFLGVSGLGQYLRKRRLA